MIVIRIEMWPKGSKEHARVMAVGRIFNNGSGTITKGNYIAELYGGTASGIKPEKADTPWKFMRPWKRCEVNGFPRRVQGCWDLLCRALWTSIGNRTNYSEREQVALPEPGDDGVIDLTGNTGWHDKRDDIGLVAQ